jgi:hypothetical protein
LAVLIVTCRNGARRLGRHNGFLPDAPTAAPILTMSDADPCRDEWPINMQSVRVLFSPLVALSPSFNFAGLSGFSSAGALTCTSVTVAKSGPVTCVATLARAS